jgi:hypothetical protein
MSSWRTIFHHLRRQRLGGLPGLFGWPVELTSVTTAPGSLFPDSCREVSFATNLSLWIQDAALPGHWQLTYNGVISGAGSFMRRARQPSQRRQYVFGGLSRTLAWGSIHRWMVAGACFRPHRNRSAFLLRIPTTAAAPSSGGPRIIANPIHSQRHQQSDADHRRHERSFSGP